MIRAVTLFVLHPSVEVIYAEVAAVGECVREDGGMCDTAGARWLHDSGGISLAEVRAILASP